MKRLFIIPVLFLILAGCTQTNHLPAVSPTPLAEILPTQTDTIIPQPTITPSLEATVVDYPAAPSEIWTTFYSEINDLYFEFPQNWFCTHKDTGNGRSAAVIINAPPGEIIAIKGTAPGFTKIQVDKEATALSEDHPFESTLNGDLTPYLPEQVLINQPLGKTAAGYSLHQLTISGLGVTTTYYIYDETRLLRVSMFYAQGELEEQPYFFVFERIVNSLNLPRITQ